MFGLPAEVVIGIVSGVGGFLMKQAAQRQADFVDLIKLGMEQNKQSSKLADAAAKRSSPFVRKVVAFFVIAVVFGGALMVAFHPEIPVSIIEPKPQKSLLWGLFTWGKTMEVTTANGLVFAPWVKYSVISIIGFLFGTGASKISR